MIDQIAELPQPHRPNPPNTGLVGMILFLASLTMLFLSAMLGYILIRTNGTFSPQLGQIHVPGLLWISTLCVLISSVTMQHALVCLRREKQDHFRLSMTSTLMLGLIFMVVQVPALWQLLSEHHRLAGQKIHLYGLIFCLVLLHAAHVLGGIIPMMVIWYKAIHHGYDHEHFRPVLYMTLYWHFLDVVWVIMFTMFHALS